MKYKKNETKEAILFTGIYLFVVFLLRATFKDSVILIEEYSANTVISKTFISNFLNNGIIFLTLFASTLIVFDKRFIPCKYEILFRFIGLTFVVDSLMRYLFYLIYIYTDIKMIGSLDMVTLELILLNLIIPVIAYTIIQSTIIKGKNNLTRDSETILSIGFLKYTRMSLLLIFKSTISLGIAYPKTLQKFLQVFFQGINIPGVNPEFEDGKSNKRPFIVFYATTVLTFCALVITYIVGYSLESSGARGESFYNILLVIDSLRDSLLFIFIILFILAGFFQLNWILKNLSFKGLSNIIITPISFSKYFIVLISIILAILAKNVSYVGHFFKLPSNLTYIYYDPYDLLLVNLAFVLCFIILRSVVKNIFTTKSNEILQNKLIHFIGYFYFILATINIFLSVSTYIGNIFLTSKVHFIALEISLLTLAIIYFIYFSLNWLIKNILSMGIDSFNQDNKQKD